MVVIFGPCAVGKMTVGQCLSEVTGYALIHNHVTIEPLLSYFDFGSPSFDRLNKLFREELIEEIAKNGTCGLIFTYVWALDVESDKQEIDGLINRFTNDIDDVCFVELSATQSARRQRNHMESRLEAKPSKQNGEWSDKNLKEMDGNYVLNSVQGHPFFYPKQHLAIENSTLEPDAVAKKIIKHFDL